MRTGIACVAAPRICPPGARAKMHTLFPDGPLEVNSRPYRTDAAREKKNCSAGVLAWINLFAPEDRLRAGSRRYIFSDWRLRIAELKFMERFDHDNPQSAIANPNEYVNAACARRLC